MVRAIQNPRHVQRMYNMHRPPQAPQVPGCPKPKLPPIPAQPPSPTPRPGDKPNKKVAQASQAYRLHGTPSTKEERRVAIHEFKQALKARTLQGTNQHNPKELFEKFQQLLSLLG